MDRLIDAIPDFVTKTGKGRIMRNEPQLASMPWALLKGG
jgi:hypothetical protein